MQDSTAGIFIIDSTVPTKNKFGLGEQAIVTGIIDETKKLLEIREATASTNGKGKSIPQIHLKAGNANQSHEEMIIQACGSIDSLAIDLP